MKEVYYFQHDYNARNDPKLQDVLVTHGAAGIGVFWCIVEQLYEQDGFLPLKSCKSIASALHVEINVVESIVQDFGLFQDDGEKFWSDSAKARLDERGAISESRRLAAIRRWHPEQEQQMQDISDNREGEEAKTAKRFCPPILEEVQSYIQGKGYSIDAEVFIAFYESKGWMVGKNKMKDWRMAVVTWSKRDNAHPVRKASITKNVMTNGHKRNHNRQRRQTKDGKGSNAKCRTYFGSSETTWNVCRHYPLPILAIRP